MAFGDALRATDGATVVLNVDTSQTQKLEQAERQWHESVGQMSREALKLDLAQDRLKKSLSQYGAESTQAKRATIALKDAEEQARRAADRTTREFREQERQLGRLTRGAVAGSGAFRGFGRMIAFASGSFLGGAGLVYGIRQALGAASNLEEQTNKVSVTFRDSAGIVLDWSRSTSTAMGVARDTALGYAGTLGNILNASGQTRAESARLSVELVKLAADMASFNNASPEETLAAIRSGLTGEIEPLRRYGVLLSEAAVKQEAFRVTGKKAATELSNSDKILARYRLILGQTTDQQGDYARTADGVANAERTLAALWRESQILLGQALLPAYGNIVRAIRDWLGDAENQRRLQEKLNDVIDKGESVVKGLAAALELMGDALRPVVSLLGGAENAAKLLLITLAVRKLLAITGAVKGLQLAIALLGPTSVASSATSVAAMNAIGTAATVNAGRVGALRAALLGLSRLTIIGGAIGVGIAGIQSGQQPAFSDAEFAKLVAAARQGRLTSADIDRVSGFLTDAQERQLRAILAARTRTGPGSSNDRLPGTVPGGPTPPREPGKTTTGRDRTGGRTLEDILLDQARAATTPGTADDVRFLREERSVVQRQIAALEARKRLTAEQKEKLTQLYGDLRSVQSQLDAIAEAEEAKLEAQKKAAREKREREAARKAKEEQQAFDRFERETRSRDLARARRFSATSGFGGGLGGAEIARRQRTSTAKSASGMTEADIKALFAQMAHQFLVTFEANQRAYGDNFGGAQMQQLVHVNREQLRTQKHLAAGSKFTEHIIARELTGAYFDAM